MANSIAELWTMQSYLQPDVLAEADLAAFDSWAATFARTVTALELALDGGSYRMKTRFARFQNVPELITLYRQVADVRTAEDLALPAPALAGGRPETVVVRPSPALRTYVADLAVRAEQVRSPIGAAGRGFPTRCRYRAPRGEARVRRLPGSSRVSAIRR